MEDGVMWNNAEQYFMASKAKLFNDNDAYRRIRQYSNPAKCKEEGRLVKNYNEQIWQKNINHVLYKGNYAKFKQNSELKALLLSTGDNGLYEASPYDFRCGIGMSALNAAKVSPDEFPGKNWLGKALMKVRRKLQEEENVN